MPAWQPGQLELLILSEICRHRLVLGDSDAPDAKDGLGAASGSAFGGEGCVRTRRVRNGSAKAPANPRERLLTATMDYVTRHGIGELTLRQLAKALGTSHRMLVYHFGSKEGLLTEAVRRSEAEQRALTTQLMADTSTPPIEQARRVWSQLADKQMWPRERLFFEVYGQALQGRPHTRALLDEIVDAWLEPLVAVNQRIGLSGEDARAAARLGLAVTRGLLLDLLATGDREGADAVMEHFLKNYMPLTGTKKKRRRTPPRSIDRGKRQLMHGTTRSARDR